MRSGHQYNSKPILARIKYLNKRNQYQRPTYHVLELLPSLLGHRFDLSGVVIPAKSDPIAK